MEGALSVADPCEGCYVRKAEIRVRGKINLLLLLYSEGYAPSKADGVTVRGNAVHEPLFAGGCRLFLSGV